MKFGTSAETRRAKAEIRDIQGRSHEIAPGLVLRAHERKAVDLFLVNFGRPRPDSDEATFMSYLGIHVLGKMEKRGAPELGVRLEYDHPASLEMTARQREHDLNDYMWGAFRRVVHLEPIEPQAAVHQSV